jgi:hypothetical protein
VAWVLYCFAFRRDEEHLQAYIDAGLMARQRQRLCGQLSTRDTGVPASVRCS